MEDLISSNLTPDETAQLKAMIEQCLQRIRESNERGMQAEAEIAELQAETRALLTQLKTTLDVEANR